MKSTIGLCSFCLLFIPASAQDDSTAKDMSYFFNDGTISNPKNAIKIGLTGPVVGEIPVQYERIFAERLALEAGVGLLLPYYGFELMEKLGDKAPPDSLSIGYSLHLLPKYYAAGDLAEGLAIGLFYRSRHYLRANSGKIIFNDIGLYYSHQLYALGSTRLIWDWGLGICFRQQKIIHANGTEEPREIRGLAMPASLRLGYIF